MIRFVVILSAVLLSACGLSPERMQAVDAAVVEHRGTVSLQPAHSPAVIDSPLAHLDPGEGRHHLIVLEQGSDALAMRIHMIRAARERIELMNFIFHGDTSGRMLLGELVDAARRGVKVRVLLDGLFSLNDDELLAGLELVHENIEIRLYNTLFGRATLGNVAIAGGTICCFRTVNHRLHHKLLSVDGRHALLGGRNTGDRYFDLDTSMNFLDLEVLVTGPEVAVMTQDFERFWSHHRSRPARHAREVARRVLDSPPETMLLPRDGRTAFAVFMAEDPVWLDHLLERASFEVDELTYFSDPPGLAAPADTAGSTGVLHGLVGRARERVVMQTPYFVLSREFEAVLAGLDPQVDLTISTNSMASLDAYPVHAISRRQRYRVVERYGAHLFEVRPFPADLDRFIRRYPRLIADRAAGVKSPQSGAMSSPTRPMPGPRISLHAKMLVIDDELSVVTSHNLDPRSETYNTENGIVVRDADLARWLTGYVGTVTAPGNSWVVAARPDGPPLIGSFNRMMARISRSLPMFDIWPWYLTQNYQLSEGAEAIAPGHPAFYEAYRPVGMAPEVVRLRYRLMASVISRMFGFMQPLM